MEDRVPVPFAIVSASGSPSNNILAAGSRLRYRSASVHTKRPLSDWLLLGLLALVWGTAFTFTKTALHSVPPATIVAGRVTVAALVLCALVKGTGLAFPWERSIWLSVVAMALLGTALPFFLVTWGQGPIDSGLAGVLMAVRPLATLVLAHFYVAQERMTFRSAVGFILGFAGIVFLMGPDVLLELGGSASTLVPQLAVLTGAVCYAVNTIIARRVPPTPALVIAAGIMTVSALVMVPLAICIDRPWRLDVAPVDAMCVVYLGLSATALAETVYFRVIATAGATFVSLMNYLIPLVAVFAGILALGEEPGWHVAVALGLILAGIGISQWRLADAA
jgi:drug/metabolite transporter (DMT)-like permease